MPKKAEYCIEWSSSLGSYGVVHGSLWYPLLHPSTLILWLNRSNTFHFCSQTGDTFTLRRETKQRGGGYWYAYKRVNGRVEKKYIGEQSKISIELLEALAQYFVNLASPMSGTSASGPPQQKPPPIPEPPRIPVLPKFTGTLQGALLIYGFASVPGREVLIARYRELSKQHHPDAGGLHEDMVAVNLAYGYLKKFL